MGRIDSDALERFAAATLAETGADEGVAETVAASLVAADLRGHPSHGVQLIPDYFGWAFEGHLEPAASHEVVADRGAAVHVDGNHAFGHAVARAATDLAVDRVLEGGHPSVTVGLRKATHIGRVGWFAEQAAAAGLGFVGFTNMTSGNPVAPAGSAERKFGTNPLTFGLPSFDALDHPVVMDMATSQVAYGKVNVRQMAGESDSIDPEWTVDEAGEPVLDPGAFNEEERGALAPLGGQTAGYKGTGLMLIAELFAATWSDSPVTPQPDSRYENSAAFTVFDPLAFTTREAHEARLLALEEGLDETEYSEAVSAGTGTRADRAYLPGRMEHDVKTEYEREGIPVPERIRGQLADLAREHGVDEGVVAPVAPE
jgi:uncharacterized oxidoreductase